MNKENAVPRQENRATTDTQRSNNNKVIALPHRHPDSDELVLVPERKYTLAYTRHQFVNIFKHPKLFVEFRIVDMGPHFEKVVARWYRLTKRGGRVGFDYSLKGDLYREYVRLFGAPQRKDRLALSNFKSVEIRGKVVTVKKGQDGRDIPPAARYSVVRQLIEISR